MRVLSPVAALRLAAVVFAPHLGYDNPSIDMAGDKGDDGPSPEKCAKCEDGLYERQRDGSYNCVSCGHVRETPPSKSE